MSNESKDVSRRRVLGTTAAGLAALAGCSGLTDSNSSTPEENDSETSTPTATKLTETASPTPTTTRTQTVTSTSTPSPTPNADDPYLRDEGENNLDVAAAYIPPHSVSRSGQYGIMDLEKRRAGATECAVGTHTLGWGLFERTSIPYDPMVAGFYDLANRAGFVFDPDRYSREEAVDALETDVGLDKNGSWTEFDQLLEGRSSLIDHYPGDGGPYQTEVAVTSNAIIIGDTHAGSSDTAELVANPMEARVEGRNIIAEDEILAEFWKDAEAVPNRENGVSFHTQGEYGWPQPDFNPEYAMNAEWNDPELRGFTPGRGGNRSNWVITMDYTDDMETAEFYFTEMTKNDGIINQELVQTLDLGESNLMYFGTLDAPKPWTDKAIRRQTGCKEKQESTFYVLGAAGAGIYGENVDSPVDTARNVRDTAVQTVDRMGERIEEFWDEEVEN